MNIFLNILFWIVIGTGLYFYINKTENDKKVIYVFIGVLVFRLIIANLKYFMGLPPNFPDSELYKESINSIVSSGMDFSVFESRIDVLVYVWFYSIIQFISGNIYITIINLNSIFGSLAIFNAGKIAGQIKDNTAKIVAMILLAVYPSFLIYTSDNLREGLVLYFITLAMYQLVMYIKHKENKNLLVYCATLIPIFLLRVVNLPIMVLIGIIGFIIVNRKTINMKYLMIGSLLVGALAIFVMYNFTNVTISLDYINQALGRGERYQSMAYLVGLKYSSWLELIAYIPIRLFYFMFHPFPWLIESYQYFTVTAASLFEFIVVVSIIILLINQRYKQMENKGLLYSFILFIFTALTIYAVVKTEAAARHRLQFMWGLPVVASTLISNQITYNKNRLFKKK